MTRGMITHGRYLGARRHPAEFNIWRKMLARCESPADKTFSRYGGRGIAVCARWQEGFRFFLEDMGPRPPGQSVERIDNDGNYEPSNCRWATVKEQANNRRDTVLVDGVPITVAAEAAGIPHRTAYQRFRRGGDLLRGHGVNPARERTLTALRDGPASAPEIAAAAGDDARAIDSIIKHLFRAGRVIPVGVRENADRRRRARVWALVLPQAFLPQGKHP